MHALGDGIRPFIAVQWLQSLLLCHCSCALIVSTVSPSMSSLVSLAVCCFYLCCPLALPVDLPAVSTMLFCNPVLALSSMLFCVVPLVLFMTLFCIVSLVLSAMLSCIPLQALSTMLFCILLLVLFTMLFCIILLLLSTMLFDVFLLVLSTILVCAGSTDVGDGSVARRGSSNQRYHDPLYFCFCLPGLPQLWRHLVSPLPACLMIAVTAIVVTRMHFDT